MCAIKTINTDIVIIGAGIAGLWLANILKHSGINCILLEADAIGAKQTINSQGMLHSGVKYALQGKATSDMQAIADSEALSVWQQAFAGQSKIQLTAKCKLIDYQYLWSNNKLSSKLANFFVSNLLKSYVEKIKITNPDYPSIFTNKLFTGSVYKLHETILDIPILLQELINNIYNNVIKIENIDLEMLDNNYINKLVIKVAGESMLLSAKQYIFTAGSGMQQYAALFTNGPKMQIRPLHMLAVKGKILPLLYGHNIDLQAIPIITISSYKTADNQVIWYCGGKIAEDGVNRDSQEQILALKKLLNSLFPWLEFNLHTFMWDSFLVNRAEYLQASGKKPNTATWFKVNNAIFAWPTKLVLAPQMATDIANNLQKNYLCQAQHDNNIDFLQQLPKPKIADPCWSKLI